MKRFLLSLLLFLIFTPIFSQKKALLTDFKFIVNDTQEFPNFFEDDDIKTIILEKGIDLIKESLPIDSIEMHQANEIEYRFLPPYKENLNYIVRQSHDFYISLITSAGVNTAYDGTKTYIIYSKVRVENKQQDTIFINRSKASFTLTYDRSRLYDEAVITKSDFKQLYLQLLKNTFAKELSFLTTKFNKPAIVAYNGFMNKAEKVVIKQSEGLTTKRFISEKDSTLIKLINIKARPMSIDGTLRIDDFADILKFNKEFILKNKTTKERLKIKGNYEETTDYGTKIRYIKSTKLKVKNKSMNYNLEFFPDRETSWVYTLEWNIDDTEKYELLANRYTNFVEIFSNGGLIAIIQLPSSGFKLQTIQNKEFTFYYRGNLSIATKNDVNYIFAFFMIANQFMAEVSEINKM
ncbi:MAG: hypothetical protein AB8G11_26695 [Saprospiraceae bacterium]